MLNPESVDYFEEEKYRVDLLFTDDNGDECIKIALEVSDARRLARMILERTAWNKRVKQSKNSEVKE